MIRELLSRIGGSIPGYDPVGTMAEGDWFDTAAAAKALEFFPSCLKHHKGEFAGRPFNLEPWQAVIVACAFGFRRADGLRRFREVYIEIPKKNGKSELAAGLALFMLVADGEPGAEIYCAAGNEDQASIVLAAARAMVETSPDLSAMCRCVLRFIRHKDAAGFESIVHVLTAKAKTKDGKNPNCLIYDELHAVETPELYDAITTGMISRRQPLTIIITTAGYQKDSICWRKHEHAESVRSGRVNDPSFLPVLWGAGVEEDWTSEAVWAKANPNLGVSVQLSALREACRKAIDQPEYETAFRTMHLCQWVSVERRWLPESQWMACLARGVKIDETPGECWGGIDLSSTTDITSLAYVFRLPNSDRWRLFVRNFIPEARIRARSHNDRVPYDMWARQGWIIPTPGNVVDHERVEEWAANDAKRFRVRAFGIDPWSASRTATNLMAKGIDIVEVRQGFRSLSEPTKLFQALVLSGRLEHSGDPVLGWAVSHVAVDMDPAGNLKFSKARSSDRIDPLAAAVNALAVAGAANERRSVYMDRGPLCI